MSHRYCVQHFTPPAKRGAAGILMWIASEPDQRALVVDGLDPEMYPDAWTDDPTKAFDFHDWPTAAAIVDPVERSAEAQAVAGRAAGLIVGGQLVRFGDAPPEEARDFGAEERAQKAAAREAYADEHMTREERAAAGIETEKDRCQAAAEQLAAVEAIAAQDPKR